MRHAAVDDIECTFKTHPGVVDIRLSDTVDDEHLMRVRWQPSHLGALSALDTADLVLLSVVRRADG